MTAEEKKVKAKNLGAKYIIGIEEDKTELYLKYPDKAIYDMFFDTYDANPRQAKESVLRTLTIPEISDMQIFDDPKALVSACNQLFEILALKKSTLKTL